MALLFPNFYIYCELHQPSLLTRIDGVVRDILTDVLNVKITADQWKQSILSTKMGGLGISSTLARSGPAYLSSVNSTQHLSFSITSKQFVHSFYNEVLSAWRSGEDIPAPHVPT